MLPRTSLVSRMERPSVSRSRTTLVPSASLRALDCSSMLLASMSNHDAMPCSYVPVPLPVTACSTMVCENQSGLYMYLHNRIFQ
ncbi:unknown protein [Oryza sativa Japonica Group]|uniref:Uncharacterized protein n=2 Tax=Oryza sativa subsp. japonica TaxID=39947 RepID=A0A979HJP0_ORYSJ|nr:unknown protein [Oryza sativa Japonica Group]BAD53947.1 unknown protein [Oryza sativa Japonica Group]BAG88364.1 unnamed protein product [Oryza sativa Japonica Group]